MSDALRWIVKFLNRIFRYPVRAEPSSYELQRHYDSMGNLLPPDQRLDRKPGSHLNELETVEEQFYEQLRRTRRERYERAWQQARQRHQDTNQQQELTRDARRWPGWNSSTLQNLSNLFALYFHRERGLLEEERASALCGDLGDGSAIHERRARFHDADIDGDGWLDFEEMLSMLYNAESTGLDSKANREQMLAEEMISLARLMDRPPDEGPLLADVSPEEVAAMAAEPLTSEEAARKALRPLARSCLEKSLRAEVLSAMSAQTQIRHGFL